MNAETYDPVTVAESLIPSLRERFEEIEEARRLPADLAQELAGAGLFRLLTPAGLGGLEVSPQTFSSTLQYLAQGDASVGWCAMIADTAALIGAYLDQDIAKEIYDDPAVILAGVYAPMGRATDEGDTYKVSGRWQWASGSANCSWLSGGSLVLQDGKPEMLPSGHPDIRMMIFPASDVELLDTWHVAGLKGTGSGDMAVTDAIVPKERTVSLITDKPKADGALYAFPVFGLLSLGIASVALGNARAALDEIMKLAHLKKSPAGKSMANRAVVQTEIAKIEADWQAACAYLEDATGQNWDAAQRDGELPIKLRAMLRLAAINATRTSADICRVAYDLGGGSSVFLSSELQRRFRDAHTMTQHIMVAPPVYELAGRVLLGVDTDTSML